MRNIIITTTNCIDNFTIKEYISVVSSNIVIGTNIFSDILASITDVFGGKSGTYQNKLELIYNDVIDSLKDKANKLNANALIGLNIDFDEISGGGKSMFMVSANATAVKIEPDRYEMYRILNDIKSFWSEGLLTDDEYKFEEKKIKSEFQSMVSLDAKKYIDEQTYNQNKLAHQIKYQKEKEYEIASLKNGIKKVRYSLDNLNYDAIVSANYDNIQFDNLKSLDEIVIQMIRQNYIVEACKYYMDETGLDEKDAIEFVLLTIHKIESM